MERRWYTSVSTVERGIWREVRPRASAVAARSRRKRTKTEAGRSSLEEHGPRPPPRGERKGDEKSRVARHDRRCRCDRARGERGELGMRGAKGWEREFILFREISLERTWRYVEKLKIRLVGDTQNLWNRERDA